jgi:hypothetical protein
MRYRSNSAATLAYEKVLPVFSRWVASGDSLYRFTLDGHPTLAVLSWSSSEEHIAAVASLPWGAGEPVVMPTAVCQQLALRSVEAAPQRPHTIRRVHRGPTGEVLRDQELPDGDVAAPGGDDAGQRGVGS